MASVNEGIISYPRVFVVDAPVISIIFLYTCIFHTLRLHYDTFYFTLLITLLRLRLLFTHRSFTYYYSRTLYEMLCGICGKNIVSAVPPQPNRKAERLLWISTKNSRLENYKQIDVDSDYTALATRFFSQNVCGIDTAVDCSSCRALT